MKRGAVRLAILCAAGGLLPLGARLWWGFELLSHFRLQYVVIAAALAVIVLVCRKPLPALLLIAVAAVNAWPLVPYLGTTGGPASAVAASGIRVLNINVNAGNDAHAAILETIRAADADIVSIVELTPGLETALRALDERYPHRFINASGDNFGIGMLSKYPLIAKESFAVLDTAAIDSLIELPDGSIRFLAVHLVPPMGADLAATRNRQLDALAARARQITEPLLVCGDFNLTPYSPYFSDFVRAADLDDVRKGQAPGFSWPSTMPLLGIPIDHCFLRAPLAVKSVERLERMGSDHYPVLVSLNWLQQ